MADDPLKLLDPFRSIFSASRFCTRCLAELPPQRSRIILRGAAPPPSLIALLHAFCPNCNLSHCRGCATPMKCRRDCKGDNCKVISCCADVRAIALFEVLGSVDREHIATIKSPSPVMVVPMKLGLGGKTTGRGGTGYSTGINYGTTIHSHNSGGGRGSIPVTNRRTDLEIQVKEEELACALETVSCLLPNPYAPDPRPYDFVPHPSVLPLLLTSYFPEVIESLLRNDSVSDWGTRDKTYQNMLFLIRRMADSEVSARVLTNGRLEKKQSNGIDVWMFSEGDINWALDENGDAIVAAPLYEYFKKFTNQCQTFIDGMTEILAGEDNPTEETMRAFSFCSDMIRTREDLEQNLRFLSDGPISRPKMAQPHMAFAIDARQKGKSKANDLSLGLEKKYASWSETAAFAYVALHDQGETKGLVFSNHHYSKELKDTQNATRIPSQRLHLIRELASMSTSLPPGAWVRVDNARNDAM